MMMLVIIAQILFRRSNKAAKNTKHGWYEHVGDVEYLSRNLNFTLALAQKLEHNEMFKARTKDKRLIVVIKKFLSNTVISNS